MMSRAAVESGAPQSEVLGLGFRHLTELAALDDDEQLATWLREAVFRIFDAVERHQDFGTPVLISKILRVIREEAAGEITRETVAKLAGVSPSHLGDLLRERTGRTFTELLREARVEKACELLRHSEMTMAEIASEVGFCDQSHFTHVFRDLKKMTPRQYRLTLPGAAKTQKFPL